MSEVTQTKEAIAAVAVVAIRTKLNLADGKISLIEALGYISTIGDLKRAFEGIAQVPYELTHLDSVGAEELAKEVSLILTDWGFTHRSADVTAELVRLAAEIVQRIQNILNLPPIPEIVP